MQAVTHGDSLCRTGKHLPHPCGYVAAPLGTRLQNLDARRGILACLTTCHVAGLPISAALGLQAVFALYRYFELRRVSGRVVMNPMPTIGAVEDLLSRVLDLRYQPPLSAQWHILLRRFLTAPQVGESVSYPTRNTI